MEPSGLTKRLLLAHQQAEEKYRQMTAAWSESIATEYIRSILALRGVPEESIRHLAEAVDIDLDPITGSEESFEKARAAQHDLLWASFEIRDLRPKEITQRLN